MGWDCGAGLWGWSVGAGLWLSVGAVVVGVGVG